MNTSQLIVSAEKSDNFIKFNNNNFIVDIDKAAHTKSNTISGMFIPVKYKDNNGSPKPFKIQTPEVMGTLVDCDQSGNPGVQYKMSILLDCSHKDPCFLQEDLDLQKDTVDILNEVKTTIIVQLEEKKQIFMEKFNEKGKTKKIKDDEWNYMLRTFEVARPYIRNDNEKTIQSHYINPKIYNNTKSAFSTTFSFEDRQISYLKAVEMFQDKKVCCVAVVSIDSLFFQTTSNKLYIQTKLDDILFTRFHQQTARQTVLIPTRLLKLLKVEDNKEEDTTETDADVDFVAN